MNASFPQKIISLFAFFFCLCKISAQTTDSLDFQQWSIPFDWIESFLQDTDSEGTFDFNTFFDQLELYAQNPINLNKATEEELYDLGLLSDVQIINFLNYRAQAGDLIAIYESLARGWYICNGQRKRYLKINAEIYSSIKLLFKVVI